MKATTKLKLVKTYILVKKAILNDQITYEYNHILPHISLVFEQEVFVLSKFISFLFLAE